MACAEETPYEGLPFFLVKDGVMPLHSMSPLVAMMARNVELPHMRLWVVDRPYIITDVFAKIRMSGLRRFASWSRRTPSPWTGNV
jgi:hypothetical protein